MKCNFKYSDFRFRGDPKHGSLMSGDKCSLKIDIAPRPCDGDDCVFMKAVDTMRRDREILEELVVVAEKCRSPYEMFSVAQKAKDHIRRDT